MFDNVGGARAEEHITAIVSAALTQLRDARLAVPDVFASRTSRREFSQREVLEIFLFAGAFPNFFERFSAE